MDIAKSVGNRERVLFAGNRAKCRYRSQASYIEQLIQCNWHNVTQKSGPKKQQQFELKTVSKILAAKQRIR